MKTATVSVTDRDIAAKSFRYARQICYVHQSAIEGKRVEVWKTYSVMKKAWYDMPHTATDAADAEELAAEMGLPSF